VAQVQNHVVTSREVRINKWVEVTLYPAQLRKGQKEVSDLGSTQFIQDTNRVLLEWMVFLESQAFNAQAIAEEQVSEAKQNFLKTARKSPLWDELGIRVGELEELLRRKLQAKKFIQFKASSSVVPVTDEEAQVYFNKNRLDFGDLPFESFRENIKAFLARKHVDKRLKDWFIVLQNKYKVRNFVTER
jgi:hypothetical protein